MKRPRTKSGHHRAQSPARASTTMITAKLIISFSIAAVLIGALVISAGGNKRTNSKPVSISLRSSLPASPLGGDGTQEKPAPSPCKAIELPGTQAAVTTLPLDEPLEGGGGTDAMEPPKQKAELPVPQQRDRPAIEAMQQAVVEAQAARTRRIAVWRIDTYLAHKNSPMQGCGEFYIQNQERTGIPGSLSAGIAEAESTNGMRTHNSHTDACPGESYNAWGMISSRFYGGFGSWENGIRANFDWLMEWHSHGGTQPPQTIHDCSGYCEGNTTNQTVDDVQWQINAYEPESIGW